MPRGAMWSVAATDGERLYVYGGSQTYPGPDPPPPFQIYDFGTQAWRPGTEPDSSDHCLILERVVLEVLNDRLHMVGTCDERRHWRHDPETESWSRRAPRPTDDRTGTSAVLDGRLYVIGGLKREEDSPYYSRDPSADVWVYTAATETWSTVSPMAFPRTGAAAGAVDGYVYVAGGGTGSAQQDLDVVERYDPATDTWTTLAPLPSPRIWAAGGVFRAPAAGRFDEPRDLFCVFGGARLDRPRAGGGVHFYDDTLCYDADADEWIEAAPLPYGLAGQSAASHDGRIYSVGGSFKFSGEFETGLTGPFFSLQPLTPNDL